jgi:hypothetical protein
MSDHTPTTVCFGFTTYSVICRCGWSSDKLPSQAQAEDQHAWHLELAQERPA